MAYTKEQKRVLHHIIDVGRKMGASRKELLAAIETALVESGARNLNYGDRDSVGWRQERSHYGSVANRMNVRAGAKRFFSETKAAGRGKGTTPGTLAQSVQRSAFPSRYDEMGEQAKDVLKASAGGGALGVTGKAGPYQSGGLTGQLKTIQGESYAAERDALKKDTLLKASMAGRMPTQSELLNMSSQLSELKDEQDQQYMQLKRLPGSPGGQRAKGGKTGGSSTNIKKVIGLAKKMGLRASENPLTGGVAAGHAPGSYHFQKSKVAPGAAVDVSGDPRQMAKFARYLAKRKGKDLEELIYRGPGSSNYMNIKKGKRVGKGFYTAHEDHVHVADID